MGHAALNMGGIRTISYKGVICHEATIMHLQYTLMLTDLYQNLSVLTIIC